MQEQTKAILGLESDHDVNMIGAIGEIWLKNNGRVNVCSLNTELGNFEPWEQRYTPGNKYQPV